MTEVGVLEARNNLSSLIKRAESGEEIVITSHGRPTVRLDPVEPKPKVGSAEAILAVLDSIPSRNASHEDIEAWINEQRNSWE